ncbi:hypothetical protein SLE2022_191020 [Rubroshorea leprosula]
MQRRHVEGMRSIPAETPTCCQRPDSKVTLNRCRDASGFKRKTGAVPFWINIRVVPLLRCDSQITRGLKYLFIWFGDQAVMRKGRVTRGRQSWESCCTFRSPRQCFFSPHS